jgi:hypothetical protein
MNQQNVTLGLESLESVWDFQPTPEPVPPRIAGTVKGKLPACVNHTYQNLRRFSNEKLGWRIATVNSCRLSLDNVPVLSALSAPRKCARQTLIAML